MREYLGYPVDVKVSDLYQRKDFFNWNLKVELNCYNQNLIKKPMPSSLEHVLAKHTSNQDNSLSY